MSGESGGSTTTIEYEFVSDVESLSHAGNTDSLYSTSDERVSRKRQKLDFGDKNEKQGQ